MLRQGGFSPADATHVSRHAMRTAIDLVGGETELASSADEATEARRRTRVQLESLPVDRYPRIVEAAVPLSSCDDPEAYYAFGLRLLLAGVEAMAPRTP